MDKIDRCPKCGSDNGFEYHLVWKTLRGGNWGESTDNEFDGEPQNDPKTVKCSSCGCRIEWNLAHGIS